MSEHVLITGGDGYVGRNLARTYLRETDATLTLQLRARDVEEAAAKREAMARALAGHDLSRVAWVHGDLTSERPFADIDPRSVTTIVHAAAVTRFNVERPLAAAVNVDGTAKVLAFAERCPRLESFGLLSTVYSCGLTTGEVGEVPSTGEGGFANHYEWSKHEAERLALEQHAGLPVRILRIATLFADGDDGRVTQYNAFHNTLKLYFYGLLSVVPGRQEAPVYLVAGDFVVRSVFRLLRSRTAGGIFNVAHERPHNPTLGGLIKLIFDIYETKDDFRSKRILRPLVTDEESFQLLAESVDTYAGAVTRQALQSMTPFTRQLYSEKTLHNERMRQELGDYVPPDHMAQLARTVEYLVATRWRRLEGVAPPPTETTKPVVEHSHAV
jgi:nucleoside-diphosphate-sugar epimerase